jgi:hypothetical protein
MNSKYLVSRKTYPTPAKKCVIVFNPTGAVCLIEDDGKPIHDSDSYTEFDSRSLANAALAKIIASLPPKENPDAEPLYSVERLK